MKKNAFTLVELIIVLTIIAVLAVIAIAYFRTQLFKGNDARRKADIARIKIALEEYEKDHNCYPPYILCGVHATQPIYPYLKDVPCDPLTKASYYYEIQDSSCPAWNRLYAKLDYQNDPMSFPFCGPGNTFDYYIGSPNAPNCIPVPGVPTPGPGGGPPPVGTFYGCKAGVCAAIVWDPSRPGPECDPNYQNSNCYSQCGPPANECQSWK